MGLRFEAVYSFNVRRFVRQSIEANTADEAIITAKAWAKGAIESEIVKIENSDGFGSVAGMDPAIYVTDSTGQEILDITLDDDLETIDG